MKPRRSCIAVYCGVTQWHFYCIQFITRSVSIPGWAECSRTCVSHHTLGVTGTWPVVFKTTILLTLSKKSYSCRGLFSACNRGIAFFCCITNHHKFNGLKQHSEFRRSEALGSLLRVLQDSDQGVGQTDHSPRAWGPLPNSRGCGKIQFLVVVILRASLPGLALS